MGISDSVWETFEGLFKVMHRQGRRVEELEARVVELERRLQGRAPLRAVYATTTGDCAPVGAAQLDDCLDCGHGIDVHTGLLGACEAADCDCDPAPAEAYLNPQDDPRR